MIIGSKSFNTYVPMYLEIIMSATFINTPTPFP